MLAVRLHAPGAPLDTEQVPIPDPRGRQVRIRVASCGVCHTDLHIVSGEVSRVTLPVTLGHEVSGWVDAWGPEAGPDLEATRLHAGDPSWCPEDGAAASVANAAWATSSDAVPVSPLGSRLTVAMPRRCSSRRRATSSPWARWTPFVPPRSPMPA